MAVITDVGDAKDIHPTRKEPVGARLALAARAIAYGEKIQYSAPRSNLEGRRRPGLRRRSAMSVADSSRKTARLKGFTIAGEDKKFVPADARIEGDQIVVSSKEVGKPVAVRYGWATVPDVNLYNKEDLPASPFRTDE